MTESEIALLGYAESILRNRGYAELANSLVDVASGQVQRRALVFSANRPRHSARGARQ
ncbi:MAG: hypothetical protein ACKOQ4_03595 [Mycobacterium sp.]